MGLIIFVGLNVLVLWWIAALFVVRKQRSDLVAAIKAHPFSHVFLICWMASLFVFGWGVLSMGAWSIAVHTPWGVIQSWQLGGIAMILGLALSSFAKL